MADSKHCITCRFYQAPTGRNVGLCLSPYTAQVNLETGEKEPAKAHDARYELNDCGLDGKQWIARTASESTPRAVHPAIADLQNGGDPN